MDMYDSEIELFEALENQELDLTSTEYNQLYESFKFK